MRLCELTGLGVDVDGLEDEALRARAFVALRDGASAYLRLCGRFERQDWLDFTPLEREAALRAADELRTLEAGTVLDLLAGGAAEPEEGGLDDLLNRARGLP